MELHKENMLGNMQSVGGAFAPGFLMLLMPGTAPTTPAEVKARMDVYDIQDMYAKSVGVAQILQTKNIAEGASFNLAPSTARSALKGGAFDYGLAAASNSAIPADMRASLPDRFFLCSKDAPFARLTENTGMAGINMMRACPWQFYDSLYGAVYPGVGNHPDSMATYVTEFEWDVARNLGGILRSGTFKLGSSNGYTITVEAWNPDTQAWDVVVTAAAKAGAVAAANYVAFSKRIVTTKMRILTVVTGTWSVGTCFYPHGIVPLEVSADAPAPAAIADIGWAVLLPMSGYHQSLNTGAGAPATFNDVTGPVPFYVASVDEAAGPGIDMVFTKTKGLMSTDKPNMVALTKFIAANIKE